MQLLRICTQVETSFEGGGDVGPISSCLLIHRHNAFDFVADRYGEHTSSERRRSPKVDNSPVARARYNHEEERAPAYARGNGGDFRRQVQTQQHLTNERGTRHFNRDRLAAVVRVCNGVCS